MQYIIIYGKSVLYCFITHSKFVLFFGQSDIFDDNDKFIAK